MMDKILTTTRSLGDHDPNVNVQETVIIFILKFGLTIASENVCTRKHNNRKTITYSKL